MRINLMIITAYIFGGVIALTVGGYAVEALF